MTELYKKAFNEASEELKQKELEKYKRFFQRTLEMIESKKMEKEKIETELRILKLDLEDLKEGKLENILERQEKSFLAKDVSVVIIKKSDPQNDYWYRNGWYNGTWIVPCGGTPITNTTSGTSCITTTLGSMNLNVTNAGAINRPEESLNNFINTSAATKTFYF